MDKYDEPLYLYGNNVYRVIDNVAYMYNMENDFCTSSKIISFAERDNMETLIRLEHMWFYIDEFNVKVHGSFAHKTTMRKLYNCMKTLAAIIIMKGDRFTSLEHKMNHFDSEIYDSVIKQTFETQGGSDNAI